MVRFKYRTATSQNIRLLQNVIFKNKNKTMVKFRTRTVISQNITLKQLFFLNNSMCIVKLGNISQTLTGFYGILLSWVDDHGHHAWQTKFYISQNHGSNFINGVDKFGHKTRNSQFRMLGCSRLFLKVYWIIRNIY